MADDTAIEEKVEIPYGVPQGIPPMDVAKRAVESGVPMGSVAEFTGYSVSAINNMSANHKWQTPRRTRGEVAIITDQVTALHVMRQIAYDLRAKRVAEESELEDRNAMLDIVEGKVTGSEVEEIMARIATRHRVRLSDVLLGKLTEAEGLRLKSMADLKNADDMIRRSMGVKDGDAKPAVNISILGGGKGVREVSGKVIPADLE